MFKSYPINSYLRVPLTDVVQNLSPEFKAHLRMVFNIRIQQEDDIKMEFASNDEVIFHYKGDV